MNHTDIATDVLTLSEAAEYLRLSPETVERQAAQGNIPGQLIEGTWRFLHAALEDWLRHRDSRVVLLQQAGVLADDERLPELLGSIYKARGRPEVDASDDG